MDEEIIYPVDEEIITPRKIYPKLEVYKNYEVPSVPNKFDQPQYFTHLENNRIQEFLSEKRKLEDRLEHYKKIKNRWTKADSSIKITGVTIVGILSVATCVFTGVGSLGIAPTTAIIVSSVFGGFNALYLFITEGISIGITSKKKKIYREICEQLSLGINRLYLFQNKALEDKILTNEEMAECYKIVKEINENIRDIKMLKENVIDVKKIK